MKIITDNEVVKVIDFNLNEWGFFDCGLSLSHQPTGKIVPSYLRIFKDRMEMEVLEFVGVKGERYPRPKIRKMKIDFVDLFKVNQLIKRVFDGGEDIYTLMSDSYHMFEEISKKENEK